MIVTQKLCVRAFFMLSLALLSGCYRPDGTRSGPNLIPDRVVVDWSNWLDDGASISWKLDPGTYRLELTANEDGVTAEWVGGRCPKTQPTREISMTCEMSSTGQLVVSNPTTFGMGAHVSTTVKVTKIR
jgi:hypothetical protein